MLRRASINGYVNLISCSIFFFLDIMFWKFVYNAFALPVMFISFNVTGIFDRKIREGIIGRRQIFEKLERQLNDARSLEKTAWFHFTSVGEFEQAKPLIEAIYSETRIILTFFSPSVATNIESYPYLDAAVYLPFDTSPNAKRLIDLINPTCLIFSRYDIWPNFVWNAAKKEIPIIVIAGTIHPRSKRLGKIGKSFFRCVHQYITLHCAISDEDADRFQQLCVSENQVVVTGDTRYEKVYQRAISVEPDTEFFPGQATLKRPIFIAGSTYTNDEKVIFDAFNILQESGPEHIPHLILVPHEPTSERITEIQNELNKRKLSHISYSRLRGETDFSDIDVLIVDTVGILAQLYQLADVAFVGGSFQGSVHNVMEPAAMGKPIIVGPTIQNSHEASLLLEKGAAKIVRTPQQTASVISDWLKNKEGRITTGNIGKQLIMDNLGAVERTLRRLRQYV